MTEQPPQPPEAPDGHLRPLGPGPLAGAAVLGLLLGWLWHPVARRVAGVAPLLSWTQGLLLLFVGAVLTVVAWVTWRTVHVRRERLGAQQMVNRLVLARACALVGALVAGLYTGYLVSWVGSPAELADERMRRSALAAVGGVTVLFSAKLLERACRVPKENPHL
ncbi:DUF3180 domain-containing protein [Nocardioides solisilvae]|uniref:DUF3180 domain-containing protein n=1 Tax=Nocardioides solisilvae TaxID=1542435 RepID=UPI001EF6930E|nr:DUF3180 domain-containing protein [Nocardioides solisilvae]